MSAVTGNVGARLMNVIHYALVHCGLLYVTGNSYGSSPPSS